MMAMSGPRLWGTEKFAEESRPSEAESESDIHRDQVTWKMSADRSGNLGWVNKALAIRSGAGTKLEGDGRPCQLGIWGAFIPPPELFPSYEPKEQCGNDSLVLPVVVVKENNNLASCDGLCL